MTGKDLWEQYQRYTRDFTKHARKLGFAGAAICWLFKDERLKFPPFIYVALLLFVAYFLSDVLQSLLGALCVRVFTEREEAKMWREKGSIEGEILKPRSVDLPASIMFCAKVVFLISGYLAVAAELVRRLFD